MPRNQLSKRTQLAIGFRVAAGSVFTLLLVIAPLNYGSTRAGGPEIIAGGCAAGTVLWLLSRAVGTRLPELPRWALVGSGLVLLSAFLWLVGVFKPTPVMSFTVGHFARIAGRWPHSIVWTTPANALALFAGLAVAIVPLIDLARTRFWALTFAITLAGTATIIAALALAQSYTHAAGMMWTRDSGLTTAFAGTFYHHTSAGAYFNTAWPLTLVLIVISARSAGFRWHWSGPALVAAFATVVILSAHGSHISRFPQLAALLILPVLLLAIKIHGRSAWITGIAASVLIASLVLVTGRGDNIVARWKLLGEQHRPPITTATSDPATWPAAMRADYFIPSAPRAGALGDRAEGWRTSWRAIAERPLSGHGPGNWMGAASHHSVDPFVRTFFQFLQFTHQDVLQSFVEWGIIGASGWWLLLFGGVGAVIRAHAWLSDTHRLLGIAAACGLGAVLLQSQLDFPLQIPAIALNVVMLAALGWASVDRSALTL